MNDNKATCQPKRMIYSPNKFGQIQYNISMNRVIDVVINRLLKYMGEQKLSQYALAQRSNLPLSTVKSIMQHRTKGIELKTIIMFASGLGVTPNEFLDDPSFLAQNLDLE